MKNVAVISDNKVVATGPNDGRLVDSYYTRVNKELYFAAGLVRAEDADLVIRLLNEQEAIKNAAEARQWAIQTIFHAILTYGLDSETYPNIRDQEWFKAIKPTI